MTRPRSQGQARHAWVRMWTKLWLNLGAEGDPQIATEQNNPPQDKPVWVQAPWRPKVNVETHEKGKALVFHRSHRSPRVYWAWLKPHPVRSRRKEFSPPETLGGGRETNHSFRKPQGGKVVWRTGNVGVCLQQHRGAIWWSNWKSKNVYFPGGHRSSLQLLEEGPHLKQFSKASWISVRQIFEYISPVWYRGWLLIVGLDDFWVFGPSK